MCFPNLETDQPPPLLWTLIPFNLTNVVCNPCIPCVHVRAMLGTHNAYCKNSTGFWSSFPGKLKSNWEGGNRKKEGFGLINWHLIQRSACRVYYSLFMLIKFGASYKHRLPSPCQTPSVFRCAHLRPADLNPGHRSRITRLRSPNKNTQSASNFIPTHLTKHTIISPPLPFSLSHTSTWRGFSITVSVNLHINGPVKLVCFVRERQLSPHVLRAKERRCQIAPLRYTFLQTPTSSLLMRY